MIINTQELEYVCDSDGMEVYTDGDVYTHITNVFGKYYITLAEEVKTADSICYYDDISVDRLNNHTFITK